MGNRVGSQSDMVSTAQRLHAGAASLACGPSGVVLEGLGWAVRPDLFAPVRRASPIPRSSRDRTFRGCLPRRGRAGGWVEAVAPRRLVRASPVAALLCMVVDIGGTALEEPGRFVRHFLQTFTVSAPA